MAKLTKETAYQSVQDFFRVCTAAAFTVTASDSGVSIRIAKEGAKTTKSAAEARAEALKILDSGGAAFGVTKNVAALSVGRIDAPAKATGNGQPTTDPTPKPDAK